MTISDSELKSYSEGAGWNKGWSEGTSQGTSQSEGKQFGGGVGVKILGNGGNISGNYGYNESESQNTSESKSENAGANTSRSETTSTGGTRNVVVWPKYDEKGNLEHLYMVILNGEKYSVIKLPYGQGKFNMVIFLPEEGYTTNDIAPLISKTNFETLESSTETEREIYFPKFEFSYKNVLNDELAGLGMTDAFDSNLANFKNITDAGIFISKVNHKTYIS